MTLRTLPRWLALACAFAALDARAEQLPTKPDAKSEPSAMKTADARVRSIERASAELARRLRDARAAGDATKQARLDDLLRQVGASLRRAAVSREELVATVAEGGSPASRLAELTYHEVRARRLVREADALEGPWRSVSSSTTVVVHESPLPDEPR